MNIDREQEVVRIGKKLEKITHSDLSVLQRDISKGGP